LNNFIKKHGEYLGQYGMEITEELMNRCYWSGGKRQNKRDIALASENVDMSYGEDDPMYFSQTLFLDTTEEESKKFKSVNAEAKKEKEIKRLEEIEEVKQQKELEEIELLKDIENPTDDYSHQEEFELKRKGHTFFINIQYIVLDGKVETSVSVKADGLKYKKISSYLNNCEIQWDTIQFEKATLDGKKIGGIRDIEQFAYLNKKCGLIAEKQKEKMASDKLQLDYEKYENGEEIKVKLHSYSGILTNNSYLEGFLKESGSPESWLNLNCTSKKGGFDDYNVWTTYIING